MEPPGPPGLTHHEMLSLIDPFVRQGWRLDLCASDRLDRRLVFKSRPVEGRALQETLALCSPSPGCLVLARALHDGGGLQARAQAEGGDAAALLARVQAVPLAQLWQEGAGWTAAHDLRMPVDARGGWRRAVCTVRMHGLVLQLDPPGDAARSAQLTLQARAGGPATLPDDLLAVLGWSWSSLRPLPGGGWGASLRLRGPAGRRDRQAAACLRQAADHLARTLADPPAAYHPRLRGARYGVVLRRSIPLLFYGALGGLAALAQPLQLASEPMPGALLLAAPPALLMLFYCRSESPRLELPPWPRGLRAQSWTG